jgi:cell division protease FtsH
MAVGDSEQEVFIGRELVQRREISERVAEQVDGEVKRLLDEAYQRAVDTLIENRQLLDTLAEALLERETLDRDEVYLLASGKPLPENKPKPTRGEPAPLAGTIPALGSSRGDAPGGSMLPAPAT